MSAPYPKATSFGSGGGDEDLHRNPYWLKSSHKADVPGDQNPYREETENDQSTQAKKIKRKSPQAKMGAGSASAAEASGGGGIEWRFKCHTCGAKFRTGQALGGHRASHGRNKGCNWLATERFIAHLLGGASINNDNNSRDGSAQGLRILDLNLPPPEEEDE